MAESLWLKGPAFLACPRDEWPLVVPGDDFRVIPESEVRKSAWVGQTDLLPLHHQGREVSKWLDALMERYSSLSKLLGVLARLLRARMTEPPNRELIRVDPTPRDREAAFGLLLHHVQADVRDSWRKGRLASLQAWVPTGQGAYRRGLLVTRGRLPSRAWIRLAGIPYLPIVTTKTPLARLLLKDLHETDHSKDPGP